MAMMSDCGAAVTSSRGVWPHTWPSSSDDWKTKRTCRTHCVFANNERYIFSGTKRKFMSVSLLQLIMMSSLRFS